MKTRITQAEGARCGCASSWKMPRTVRTAEGGRVCSRCWRKRGRVRALPKTEDVMDMAVLELASDVAAQS